MEKLEIIKEIQTRISCNDYLRLGRCFETKQKKYFYDLGTGKVFEASFGAYMILEFILQSKWDEITRSEAIDVESLMDVLHGIRNENILQAPELKSFIGLQISSLEEELRSKRAQITLELTERCNMRCKYCIYHEDQGGYRKFGRQDMSFDIAKRAIDDLVDHSKGEDKIYVSFYGGEPLISMSLLKECINYCQTIDESRIHYAITTNATLITESIADFFAELGEKIHITVSLDGPKDINDSYRVYSDGGGTFDDAVQGIKQLVESFDRKNNILSLGINSVLSEYTEVHLDKIEDYFGNQEWIPDDVVYTSSFVATKDQELNYLGVDSDQERTIIDKSKRIKGYFDPLLDWAIEDNATAITEKLIAKDNIIKEMAMIHKRLLYNEPIEHYYMCGCCVPGARRVYVTSKGDYLFCEKLGEAPNIGNVFDGIDISKTKRHYVNDYCRETQQFCKDCWAIHLCGMCYMNCYDKDGINIKLRNSKCIMNRIYIEKNLELYHELLENKSDLIIDLDDYEFS